MKEKVEVVERDCLRDEGGYLQTSGRTQRREEHQVDRKEYKETGNKEDYVPPEVFLYPFFHLNESNTLERLIPYSEIEAIITKITTEIALASPRFWLPALKAIL